MKIRTLKRILQVRKPKWSLPADIDDNIDTDDLKRIYGLGANPPPAGTLTARSPRMRNISPSAFNLINRSRAMMLQTTSAPSSWDWRDVEGKNYIGAAKNQGSCGSCVAFASIATLEANWRIASNDHNMSIDLSEGALFFIPNRRCEGGWNIPASLDFLMDEGACFENNLPYRAVNQTAELIKGTELTKKITGYDSTTQVNQMKRWIREEGPLVTRYDVYNDFFGFWQGGANGVYSHVTGELEGGHAVSVIGYDDDAGCWICKNSWGPNGSDGCFRIGYNQCGINNRMYLIEDPYEVFTVDELHYNPRNLRIVNEGSRGWLLTDGRSRMKMLDNREDARNALRVARRHTRRGFVGRDNPRRNRIDYITEYWAGNSGLTHEPLTKVDGIPYNASNIIAEDLDDKGWRLKEGNKWMLLADDMNDAAKILKVAQRHSRMCFIGRGNKRPNRKSYIMTYWE
ncbi:MAG: C1 family peptidase [Balneolia bacterium]|nr:C1 family peptidase [Balneolia bacterium]